MTSHSFLSSLPSASESLASEKLGRDFFRQDTLTVSRELLGATLVFGPHRGIITETEAYIGRDDPACHAARGRTKRNAVMFEQAGLSYIYLIYGMYHCLNIVTEEEGFPAAVLIRGLHLTTPPQSHLDGPGKLCRELGLTREHNARDLTEEKDFYLLPAPSPLPHVTTPRIGISQGTDKLWRFAATPPY